MLKAGLIGAGVGLVLGIIAAVITPICNPCAALVVGIGVGILAGVFAKPLTGGAGAGEGAKAGAIAGVGSLLGQMIGAVINGFIVGAEGVAQMYRNLNIPVDITPQSYWLFNLGGNCLCALVNVGLAAGLGALGGLLWYQIAGKKQQTSPPPATF